MAIDKSYPYIKVTGCVFGCLLGYQIRLPLPQVPLEASRGVAASNI